MCFTDAKISIILVNSSNRTKFFVNDVNQNGYLNQPNPGTLFEKKIFAEDDWSFYISSQKPFKKDKDTGRKSGKNNITPTLYTVFYDDNALSPNQLYPFIYKLTYLYYNTIGPFRIPAPLQYCFRMTKFILDRATYFDENRPKSMGGR